MQKSYFKKVDTYLKQLVSETNEIQKYIGPSEEELHSEINNLTDVSKPLLVFFGYKGNLNGHSQRTIGVRTVSFAVVYIITDANDFEAQVDAIDDAETIGLEVMARMFWDSTPEGKVSWLYNSFKKESVRFEKVEFFTPSGMFGQEFFFDLDFRNALQPDSDFWNGKKFCTS